MMRGTIVEMLLRWRFCGCIGIEVCSGFEETLSGLLNIMDVFWRQGTMRQIVQSYRGKVQLDNYVL